MQRHPFLLTLLAGYAVLAFPQFVRADGETTPSPIADLHLSSSSRGSDASWAKFASGSGNVIFLAAGTLLPLVEDGKDGKEHTFRTADALLTATVLDSGLKIITHEKRPDGSDHRSFPSGHATAAFAVATMEAHYHPKQALLWYAGASAIGVSRVALDRHYWHDVAAGAALGYFTAKFELKQKRGFVLRPYIHGGSGGENSQGVAASMNF